MASLPVRTFEIRISLCVVFGALLLSLILLVSQLADLRGYDSADYRTFHGAAQRLVASPVDLYVEPQMAHRAEAAETLIGFLYPPPAALAFAPLALAGPGQGFGLFVAAIVLAAIAALGLWAAQLARDRHVGGASLGALAALALVSGPVAENWLGQVDTFILLLTVSAIVASARGRPGFAGALVAAGCWIKVYPVVLLVLAAAPVGRARFLGAFAIAALAIPLASLAILPASLLVDYFGTLLPAMSGRVIVNIDNQSLLAVAARAGIPVRTAIETYAAVPTDAGLRALVNLSGLAGIAAILWRTRGTDPLLVASWALATVPLIAPLGWGHTYAYALPLWMLTASRALADRQPLALAGLAIAWIGWLPSGHHILPLPADAPHALFVIGYARMALVTLLVMAIAGWQAKPVNPILARFA